LTSVLDSNSRLDPEPITVAKARRRKHAREAALAGRPIIQCFRTKS
jgi:hypothetical protein